VEWRHVDGIQLLDGNVALREEAGECIQEDERTDASWFEERKVGDDGTGRRESDGTLVSATARKVTSGYNRIPHRSVLRRSVVICSLSDHHSQIDYT
jgi:hypothetical protein